MLNKDIKKLIENAYELYCFNNSFALLQENSIKYLITEASALKDAVESAKKILNNTKQSSENLKKIIENIFSKAKESEAFKNEENKNITFDESKINNYFDELNKTLNNNESQINKISASSNLKSRKKMSQMLKIKQKIFGTKVSLKGLTNSIINYLDNNVTVGNLNDDESIISTLDEKSAKKLQGEIAKELEKSFKEQETLGEKFKKFFKFDLSNLFGAQTDPLFNELAAALLFIPKNDIDSTLGELKTALKTKEQKAKAAESDFEDIQTI
jgi:hypothetical protein